MANTQNDLSSISPNRTPLQSSTIVLLSFLLIIVIGAIIYLLLRYNQVAPNAISIQSIIPQTNNSRYDYKPIPNYQLSVAIVSQLAEAPIDSNTINTNKFSQLLQQLNYSNGQVLVGLGINQTLKPNKIALILKDINNVSESDAQNFVIQTTSGGKLVSGFSSTYDPEYPEELIYNIYLHPDLYKDRPIDLNETNTNRTLASTLFYAMFAGTNRQTQDNMLNYLSQAFPQGQPPELLVKFTRKQ